MKFALFLWAALLSAAPMQIEYLKQIETEPGLYVFDVDEVLIMTEDHFTHPDAVETFHAIVGRAFQGAKEEKELVNKLSLTCLLPKRKLIEEGAPSQIEQLQKGGMRTIALTACSTGPFGAVLLLERWRIEQLKSFEIDFSDSFPEIDRTILLEGALFEEGILFSGSLPKGEVLKAFLEKSGFRPPRVIFIDDRMSNLHSVEAAMQEMGIPCTTYQYVGAHRHFKPLNRKILELQVRRLLEEGIWVNDADAER